MKKDHYVYVYKDIEGNIIYIGEGRANRYKSMSGRTKEFIEFISKNYYTVEIVKDNLTKIEAQTLECELINKHSESLNKNSTGFVHDIDYQFFNEYFYVDDTSPTNLRWKKSIYSGEYMNVLSVSKDSPAGHFNNGYLRVSLKNKSYKVSRILWCLYHKQNVPKDMVVSYVDGDHTNNAKENLKLTTISEAVRNYPARQSFGKSGIVGISVKVSKRGIRSFYATIRFNGKLYEKGFSELKYGYKKAIELALAWRSSKIAELYEQEKK